MQINKISSTLSFIFNLDIDMLYHCPCISYSNLVYHFYWCCLTALSNGLSALGGSIVQLECPYTATDGKRLSWTYISSKGFLKYSENSLINPNIPTDLRKRLNITGNHTNGEYHLNITDVRESDEGKYECSVSGTSKINLEQLTIIRKIF